MHIVQQMQLYTKAPVYTTHERCHFIWYCSALIAPSLARLLETGDRASAGRTAPSPGLLLVRVHYPGD